MCKCKTSCSCNKQHIPVVGEVWTRKLDDATAKIIAVAEDRVWYLYNRGTFTYGTANLIEEFTDRYNPPKPEPRVLYISKIHSALNENKDYYTKEWAEQNGGLDKFIKFVEEI